MEDLTYNQEEVLKNIEFFRKQEEDLIIQRKELNKAIKRAKDQREYWTLLDVSQLKLI